MEYTWLPVRYIQASIKSSLHCSEDPVAGRGPCQTNVQEAPEGTCPVAHVFDVVVLSISLRLTFVLVGQFQLTQHLGRR